MILKKVAAVISAAAVALALTGCGNNSKPAEGSSSPQNVQSGGAVSNPVESTTVESTILESTPEESKPTESKPAESKPAENKPEVQLPDIPVTDASAFEYYYDDMNGGITVTDYKLQDPKVHIPEKLDNEKVVRVLFTYEDKNITHLIMPDSVYTFVLTDGTKSMLQFVNVPSGVTEIYAGIFTNCTSLTDVIISDGVTKIGEWAFNECTSLTRVTIPDSVTEIGESAFVNCTSLTSITIPDSVTEIHGMIFAGCMGLTSVTIPDSVTKLDISAFADCYDVQVTYKGKTYDYEHMEDLYYAVNGN